MAEVTVNKRVIVIEPNHLNGWFIQERITVMLFTDAKLCADGAVAEFGFILLVKLSENRRYAVWNISLLINFLHIDLL